MIPEISLLVVLCLSWGLTGLALQYARHRQLMDVPTQRSSHSVPTPRGGGVGFVVTFSLYLLCAWMWTGPDHLMLGTLLFPGLLIAGIGFVDDHGHVPAGWRLIGQGIAAALALAFLPDLPPLNVAGIPLSGGPLWAGFYFIYLLWLLNLYNFMDGIDGLASVQALTCCLSACAVYWGTGHEALVMVPLALAVATAGFIAWNFPPARIFMGDVGSGYLGFSIGVLSLQASAADSRFFWVWAILMGNFIVDATVTLLRRLFRGERVYQAHRSHAYQHAAARLSHRTVTLAVASVNLAWLLPIAFAVAYLKLDGASALCLAYLPILILVLKYDAGRRENRKE